MKTLFDTKNEVGVRFRIKQLKPNTPARWGKTTAPRVLAHLVDVLEAPLDTSSAPGSALLKISAMRWLHIRSMPCPDGKLLVSEEVTPAELAAWNDTAQKWYDACSRFVARFRTEPPVAFAPHPLYGPLPADEWGRLVYYHIDHHLNQFGV